MSENLKSKAITQGVQRSPNRAMLRAVGFQDEDFNKAIVGIANGYSTITPCNMGINQLAQRAEAAVKTAGAMPQIFGTITVINSPTFASFAPGVSVLGRMVSATSFKKAMSSGVKATASPAVDLQPDKNA